MLVVDEEDVVDDEEDDTLVVVAIEVVSSAVVVVDAKNYISTLQTKVIYLTERTHVFALLCALPSTRKQSFSFSFLFLFFVVDQNDTGAMQKREGLG